MTRPMALLMSFGGPLGDTVANGYADAFDRIGWDHMVASPKTRLQMIQLLHRHEIKMIFTLCKYGTRQLPIDIINQRKIKVVVQALLFNARNETFGGTSECVDPSDPYTLSEIESKIIHTNIEPGTGLWDRYFHRWFEMDMPLAHIPLAGNLVRGLPRSVEKTHDIACVGNFGHKADVLGGWVMPMLARLPSARTSFHGDSAWNHAGRVDVRPLRHGYHFTRDIYGSAKVSVNLHSREQRDLRALVNERTFTIPLCGGFQVTDNPVASKYLGDHVVVANNPTEFIVAVETAVAKPPMWHRTAASIVAHKETYFNRLASIFGTFRMTEDQSRCQSVGQELALNHVNTLEEMYELQAV